MSVILRKMTDPAPIDAIPAPLTITYGNKLYRRMSPSSPTFPLAVAGSYVTAPRTSTRDGESSRYAASRFGILRVMDAGYIEPVTYYHRIGRHRLAG